MLSTLLALSTLLTYLRFIHLLANSALLLTLVYCTLLQYIQKSKVNVPFHILHLLSGTIFLKLFETQIHQKNLSVSALQVNDWYGVCVCVCVCACMHVCVCVAGREWWFGL